MQPGGDAIRSHPLLRALLKSTQSSKYKHTSLSTAPRGPSVSADGMAFADDPSIAEPRIIHLRALEQSSQSLVKLLKALARFLSSLVGIQSAGGREEDGREECCHVEEVDVGVLARRGEACPPLLLKFLENRWGVATTQVAKGAVHLGLRGLCTPATVIISDLFGCDKGPNL